MKKKILKDVYVLLIACQNHLRFCLGSLSVYAVAPCSLINRYFLIGWAVHIREGLLELIMRGTGCAYSKQS